MESKGWQLAEKEFFLSLDHLCAHVEIPLPDVSGLTYPQNVAVAVQTLNAQLEHRDGSRRCFIIRDDNHRATLAIGQRYNTGSILYYIPVRPLWNMTRTMKLQPLAELLMSVYAYLYRIAKVPFYTDEGEYLNSEYDMLLEWLEEDDEELHAEMELLMNAGKSIAGDLKKEHWLHNFQTNIDHYRECEACDQEFLNLSEDFLNLYRAYPERSLFEKMQPEFFPNEQEDVRIYGEMYISFYWSAFDHFYDDLFKMVNNEFNECSEMEEPHQLQVFDRPQTDADRIDFDFEKQMFTLLDRLCEIMQDKSALYDYGEPAAPETSTSI